MMKPATSRVRPAIIAAAVATAVVVIAALGLLIASFYHPQFSRFLMEKFTPRYSSVPLPSPNQPEYTLPEGTQTYTFTHGPQVTGPKIEKVTFDPLAVSKVQTQTITLVASHTDPIQKVELTIQTDTKSKKLTLKRISGSDTAGTWQGRWTFDDTMEQTYAVTYVLESKTGTYNETMYFRKSL